MSTPSTGAKWHARTARLCHVTPLWRPKEVCRYVRVSPPVPDRYGLRARFRALAHRTKEFDLRRKIAVLAATTLVAGGLTAAAAAAAAAAPASASDVCKTSVNTFANAQALACSRVGGRSCVQCATPQSIRCPTAARRRAHTVGTTVSVGLGGRLVCGRGGGVVPEEEFRRVFNLLHDDVRRYAMRRVDPATADEVIVDTFIVVWRKGVPPVGDAGGGVPRAWVLGVARRVLANARRSSACRERNEWEAVAQMVHAGSTSAADPAGEVAERRDGVEAFRRLRLADQEILRLVAWEGLGVSELAAVLGCSPKAASVRLTRARRRLETLLEGRAASEEVRRGVPWRPSARRGVEVGIVKA